MVCHPSLNARIVAWVRQQPPGARNGNGECWTLAENALRAANARTSRDLTPHFSTGADYVWGDEERNRAAIVPGDILQMRNYRVQQTTRTVDFMSGPGGRAGLPRTLALPHHTAIVVNVVAAGLLLEVAEQNVPLPGSSHADRVVQINRFALASCQGPPQVSYSDSGDRESRTTDYAVLGGQVRAFHPQPR